MRTPLLCTLLCLVLGGAAQAGALSVTASSSEYNRLVFPEPYDRVVIPPTAELADEPIPLQGYRGLLIRPEAGADPIPVFVQLRSGESFTIRLEVEDDAPGAVFRYREATDISTAPARESRPADGWIARTMLAALVGDRPSGFESGGLPSGSRLFLNQDRSDHVELLPIARYRGSQHDLAVYRLVATTAVNIEPRDFYRDGVVAVVIESDVVSKTHKPLLVVLEAAHE